MSLRLLGSSDALRYFEAIDTNREFLSVFEESMVSMYPDIEAVRQDLTSSTLQTRHFGVLADDEFAGSVSLRDRHDDTLVGVIGYWLQERFTGRGHMSIAVRSLTRYLAYRYYWYAAAVLPANTASVKTLQAAGFAYERKTTAGYSQFVLNAYDLYLHPPHTLNTNDGSSI